MQANNAIPYLQIQTPQQADYKGSSGKSDKDNSFSNALDKELSQGKNPAEKPESPDKSVTGEKPAVPDKPAAEAPGGDKIEAADSQIAVVIPLIVQNPNLQYVQTEQQPQVQQTEILAESVSQVKPETKIGIPAILSQTAETDEIMTSQTKTPITFQQAAETANAAPAAVENRQPVMENQVKTEAASTPQPVNMEKGEAIAIKPVAEGETNQSQTELKDANLADMSKAVRQDMVGRQAAFEAPQVTEKPTVDMTDVKAGIQKLSQTMADHMAKGRTEFEIWLEPANLGKMAIKVAYEGGRAMVSIMCTNEKAMEMISQNARNLGNILEQHTGNDTVVVVEHPQSDYLQQQAEQENKEGYQQQEQNSDPQDDTDGETQTFLEQLRLGLM